MSTPASTSSTRPSHHISEGQTPPRLSLLPLRNPARKNLNIPLRRHRHGTSNEILRAAGPELPKYFEQKYPQGVADADAATTPSFDLDNCKHTVHARRSNWDGGHCVMLEKQLLADCYTKCMEEVLKLGVSSVAFSEVGCAGLRYVYSIPVVILSLS